MAADAVFASLEACVDQVDAWVCRPTSLGETPPVLPDTEQAQIAALQTLVWLLQGAVSSTRCPGKSRRPSTPRSPSCPSSTRCTARPGAGSCLRTPWARSSPHEDSLDAHVVAANEVLVSEDVTKDPRFADDPLVLEKGIRFYAGAPLRTSSGLVVGCLVHHRHPTAGVSGTDRQRLQEMADELMTQIEDRAKEMADHPQKLVQKQSFKGTCLGALQLRTNLQAHARAKTRVPALVGRPLAVSQ